MKKKYKIILIVLAAIFGYAIIEFIACPMRTDDKEMVMFIRLFEIITSVCAAGFVEILLFPSKKFQDVDRRRRESNLLK